MCWAGYAFFFHRMKGRVPVIGIAKKAFTGISSNIEIFRGDISRPLFIASVGLSLERAKQNIHAMQGKYRMPTLLSATGNTSRKSNPGALSTDDRVDK